MQANIDDLVPELVPDVLEACVAAGAIDVWTAPIQMKKARPGVLLSVLGRPDDERELAETLLRHSSTLGVRVQRLERYELDRAIREVQVGGHPMADYAAKEMKLKRMITITEDFAFGYEQMGGFQQTFEDNGGKILKKLWPPLATPDYTPYLAQIADCDGVCQGFAGGNPLKFMKQYASAGLKFPVVTGQTGGDDALLRSYGDEAIGLISSCPYTLDAQTEANKRFVAGMQKNFNLDPGFYAAGLYINCMVIDEAPEEIRWKERRQGGIHESPAFGFARRYAAWAGQVRSPRQRGWQHVHPQMREGRWQAREHNDQDLHERQPVLDLRREEVPRTAGLFARLPASQILMQDMTRAPHRRPRFFDTASAGRRRP